MPHCPCVCLMSPTWAVLDEELIRAGTQGTPRRKKKVVHKTSATDDKKLLSTLKKLNVNTIPGVEEVGCLLQRLTTWNLLSSQSTVPPAYPVQRERLSHE